MPRTSHPVLRALSRWEAKGLLTPEVTAGLRGEMEEELQEEGRRWSQYLLAGTGGAVLIVAGSTFLAWAWPSMGPAGQALSLGVIGLLILGLGIRLPGAGRWVPVAYLLQISGPVLVFMAFVHSERAWPDGTLGGVGAGVLGLVIPLVLVWISLRRDAVLAAIQAALGFLFLYAFFDRALSLDEETILWILDGIMVVGLAGVGYRLKDPEGPEWAMPVFASLVFAALILLIFSGDALWHLDAYTVVPLDIWLITVAGLSFWGLQEGTPAHLRRDWLERVLALCVLLGIAFGFMTTLEALDTGPTAAAMTVGGVGGLGLWYALPRGSREVLVTSCLALLISSWYYGAETGGALGAVLALAIMAAVLFWGSARLGKGAAAETPPAT